MTRRWRLLAVSLRRLLGFARRVVADFIANRGILLAGGVGYNVLLSIVPLFAVCAAALSPFLDQARLVATIRTQAQFIAPGYASVLVDAVEEFLEAPAVIGVVGFLVLLFFSSLAFRMLQDAMAIIFQRQAPARGRSPWLSAFLPYAYVMVLALGILALTLLAAALDVASSRLESIPWLGGPMQYAPVLARYGFGFIALALLFASLYKVLPAPEVALRRALIGGFVAATLWELTLQAVMYYFENLSLVNAVYGSFATLIVVLLSLELGAAILLLGAQVIAELERSAAAGLPWYRSADRARRRSDASAGACADTQGNANHSQNPVRRC